MSAEASNEMLAVAHTRCPPPSPLARVWNAVAEALLSERDREAALVEAMATGDRGEALAEFYKRYAGKVMALLYRMLRSRALAEERHQDVFIELWRRAPQYDRSRAAVSTWVMTVARSRALDTIRSRSRQHAEAQVPSEDVHLPAPESDRPDVIVDDARRRESVRAALATLSDPQQEVLGLAYFSGLSHSEIADQLELPLGTVKSRILGAMKLLRKKLGGGGLL